MPASEADLWGPDGAFANHFPGYEPRNQQQRMYRAVTAAIQRNQHLMVEAGTGTGKSLAYLAPAMMATLRNNDIRVVVSTATINLQEQLVNKDIPAAAQALEQAGIIEPGALTWTTLKGKSNYLCHEQSLAFSQQHDDSPWHAATTLLRKIDNWRTQTGDRAELSLRPDENWPWSLMSARFSNNCSLYHAGNAECYLHNARQRARRSHIVVTNHALLLSDIAAHDPYLGHITHVIIDEAHHLEEEASRQFGWELTQAELPRFLNQLDNDPALAELTGITNRAWQEFWQKLTACGDDRRRDDDPQITVNPKLRSKNVWKAVTTAADALLEAAAGFQAGLNQEISNARNMGNTPREAMLRPIATAVNETRNKINTLTSEHDPESVQWIQPKDDDASSVHSIPLRVGPLLREQLFDRRQAVILTSATLTTEPNDFTLLREQTGFPAGRQLSLESPFNYTQQARFMSPADLPNPKQFREFGDAVAHSLFNLVSHLDGHTMALFTSNAAIRAAARQLRGQLAPLGITTLAQGIDGGPADIIANFRADPRAVILGTNSFWEGVDLSEDLLHAVAICRLPFPVPTDPVIEARSRLFDDPFVDYHIPMAVLRFRQGFGRLVRNGRSRGSVVILDPRIRHPRYGRQFFDSLPTCDYVKATIDTVGQYASQWLQPDIAKHADPEPGMP